MFGFFKTKADLTRFVREKGGMHELYKEFIELFSDQGFQLREVNEDSVYLHYGSADSKVGVQLIQLTMEEVQILISEETPTGLTNSDKLRSSTRLKPRETFESIMESLKYTVLKFHEGDIQSTIDTAKARGLSDDEIERELGKKMAKWHPILDSEKVSREMKDAIREFLIPDGVNAYFFSENMRVINDGAFYYALPPRYNATKSMNNFGNVPSAYPTWFVAGYPDVLVWVMDSLRDSSSLVYKTISTDKSKAYFDGEVFTVMGLRKLIDLYKHTVDFNLESAG